MQHEGSAYLSTKRGLEDAEDRGERRGIARGIEMVAAWLDAKGQRMLAAELREAKVIERTEE